MGDVTTNLTLSALIEIKSVNSKGIYSGHCIAHAVV
jgi:hypothetical protein